MRVFTCCFMNISLKFDNNGLVIQIRREPKQENHFTMAFCGKHASEEDLSPNTFQVPTGQPSWQRSSNERMQRFTDTVRRLSAKRREILQHIRESSDSESDINEQRMDVDDTKDESEIGDIDGSEWVFGDEEKKSGCAHLAKIIRAFAEMDWDPLNPAGPWPDCVNLSLTFLLNLVSEEILDFILDILRWWQEEEVSFEEVTIPTNAKKLKRDKKEFLPDLSQFVGVYTGEDYTA